jgi:hypothetical protein
MDPKGPYVIPETTREAFIEVLSYLYSGNMNLTVDNVQVCPPPPLFLLSRLFSWLPQPMLEPWWLMMVNVWVMMVVNGREVDIMTRLRCPYVLNFVGASFVPGKTCLVTEICTHGSVSDIVFSDKNFNYLMMLKVALDMAKAISFLHTYARLLSLSLPCLQFVTHSPHTHTTPHTTPHTNHYQSIKQTNK